MELLGNIGAEDQLTSVREENKILQERCKALTDKVRILTVENESLKAELEMYRHENPINNFTSLTLGSNDQNQQQPQTITINYDNDEVFVKSGNGIHVSDVDIVTMSNLHYQSNILSCSLSKDEVFLMTGGADNKVRITQWGVMCQSPNRIPTTEIIQNTYSDIVDCDAPVISCAFSSTLPNVAAVGCMDGNVHLLSYRTKTGYGSNQSVIKCYHVNKASNHRKYIKTVAWSPTQSLLATSSADGTIQIYNVSQSDQPLVSSSLSDIMISDSYDDNHDDDMMNVPMKYDAYTVKSIHLSGPIECLTFNNDGTQLYCYARGKPHLSCFDIAQDFQQSTINLNATSMDSTGTNGFTDHVSFTVMDIAVSSNQNGTHGNNSFLALATDTSRNIILDIRNSHRMKQVRNLYGHTNDQFSQPKIGWSYNGQYIYGNTQHDTSLCIWDIASAKIIKEYTKEHNGHSNTIRDLYSSPYSDIVVTTSYDKQTKLWFPDQSKMMY